MTDYDVAIVGGSIAGSTAAALLGRQGLKVALIEKSPDPDHYKSLCTHELIGLANPVLTRLGILDEVERIGGTHRSPQIWTRYGWVKAESGDGDELSHGHNVRREKLDPLVRSVAAGTDGVDVLMGTTVADVLTDASGRPSGVRVRSRGALRELTARVVVGADGRASSIAEKTGVKARIKPHARLGYGAYYENLPLTSGDRSQMWLRDPDVAYAFPTDANLTLLAISLIRTPERVAEFRSDLRGAFERQFDGLVEGPNLSKATHVGKFTGAVKVENKRRPASAPGVAFVGDAAQVTDYVWGTGCGFAFRSSELLADAVGPVLAAGGDDAAVDDALVDYRRAHRKVFAMHQVMLNDYSSGRRFSPVEKLLFSAGVFHQPTARAMHHIGERSAPPQQVLTPRVLAGAAAAHLRRKLAGSKGIPAVSSSSWPASSPSTSASPRSSGTGVASPS